MRNKLRSLREALSDTERDKSKWPTVDETVLSENDRTLFLRRRRAIHDYVDGKSYKAIRRDHQISSTRLWMLRERFFAKHSDGRIYGERALIPRKRIKPYERRAEDKVRSAGARGGHSGALTRLFERFPEIKEFINELFLKRRKAGVVHESRIPTKALHKHFVDKCRSLGIKGYPITTEWRGRRALHTYVKRLAYEHTEEAIKARYGENAARRYSASGEGADSDVTRPYQRVQCDAHKIDAQFTIWLPHPRIGHIPVNLPRIWLLAIIDVFSRAVLSYYLVLSLECSARDVTRVIQRAVMPWPRRTFTIPALRYPEQGGFPSGRFPALAWAAWDEIWFDNAKVNLAELTLDTLITKMRSRVHAGAVNALERRAIMERLFLTIEENGFHRLPSTTGSHPRDPRRQKPEEQALKYDIRLEHLEDLIEVIFAQYNATPHTALGHRTPLEVIEHYLATGGKVRPVAEEHRTDATFLYVHDSRTVRGSLERSRKPYIEFEGAIYQNEVLARSADLIGSKLTLHVNPDDLRLIKAFLPDGAELGMLAARAPWHRFPHSLETRTAINALRHRKLIAFTEMDDPIAIYHDYLAEEALKKKRSRPRFERARRERAAAAKELPPVELTPSEEVETPIQPATPTLVVVRRTVTF